MQKIQKESYVAPELQKQEPLQDLTANIPFDASGVTWTADSQKE